MFLGLPSFFSFLEGLTNGLTIPEGCEILEATRATFLEVLCSSVDTPGSVAKLVALLPSGARVRDRTRAKNFEAHPIRLMGKV